MSKKITNVTSEATAIEYILNPTKVEIREYLPDSGERFLAYQCGDIEESNPDGRFSVSGEELSTLESRYKRAAEEVSAFEACNTIVDTHDGEKKNLFGIGLLADGRLFGLLSSNQCQTLNMCSCRHGELSTWAIGDVFNRNRLDLTDEDMMAQAIMDYNREIKESIDCGAPCADPWNGIIMIITRKVQ